MDKDYVSYIVYESSLTREERHIKRLTIIAIVAIILLFLSNAIWLYAWCQYDYSSTETETITVDGQDGIANYIGNSGVTNNGESHGEESQETNPYEEVG